MVIIRIYGTMSTKDFHRGFKDGILLAIPGCTLAVKQINFYRPHIEDSTVVRLPKLDLSAGE
jgi:hypothetical protein